MLKSVVSKCGPIILVVAFAMHAEADTVGLERLATGLNKPVFVTSAPGDRDRLFIVERGGAIKILDLNTGTVNGSNFLTIGDTFSSFEAGLLGLAFHPDYATNNKFYTYVTVDDGGVGVPFRSYVREYTVSGNPDIANTGFTDVIAWDQPQENHNAGWIGFGPNDDFLYIMSGDGGGANDSGAGHTTGIGNAQDKTNNRLGKVLRIDVDGNNGPGSNYGIPSTNPFFGVGVEGDDEIWAYGLRNPWRASFDRQTGDLWIGDVGQDFRDEINFQPASSTGGENYGWRLREGFIPTPTGGVGGDPPDGNVDPVYDYTQGNGDFQGRSVVGGYVYRGPDPELQGTYFFGDSGSEKLWSFDPTDPLGTVDRIDDDLPIDTGETLRIPVSFGEDAVGNLYVVRFGDSLFGPNNNQGAIYRIVTDALIAADFDADGDVDGNDQTRWETGFGMSPGATFSDGDADDDGDVDGSDFLAWQRNLGATAQGVAAAANSASVPEPSSLGLLIIATLVLKSMASIRRQPTA